MYYLDGSYSEYLSRNGYGTIPSNRSSLPLHGVLAGISNTMKLSLIMSTELQSPEVNSELKKEEENEIEDQLLKNVEQEIECPRCSEIMMLSSDVDKLGYICQEGDLLLVMK